MKTQLLQDFNESGSAPAEGRRQRPAPEADAAAEPSPASMPPPAPPAPPAAPEPGGLIARAAARGGGAPPEPRPAAPTPTPAPVPPLRAAAPSNPSPAMAARPMPAPGLETAQPGPPGWPRVPPQGEADPDWLAERLARDLATHEQARRSTAWRRRLAGWGTAAVLLALLGTGGFWLMEEKRVEGSLAVVANTNPLPAPAAQPGLAAKPVPLPVPAPMPATASAPAPLPASPTSTTDAAQVPPTSAAPEASAVGGLAGPATAAGDGRADAPVPPRKRSRGRRHAATAQSADASAARQSRQASPVDDDASPRQRREETLMQCRAHGYDEAQCLRRGCEMTRYGFACKG